MRDRTPTGSQTLALVNLEALCPACPQGRAGTHSSFGSSSFPFPLFHHLGLITDHSRDGHVLPIRYFPSQLLFSLCSRTSHIVGTNTRFQVSSNIPTPCYFPSCVWTLYDTQGKEKKKGRGEPSLPVQCLGRWRWSVGLGLVLLREKSHLWHSAYGLHVSIPWSPNSLHPQCDGICRWGLWEGMRL